jgi:glycosyltransferase involved in cell wall biosynthesis
LIPASQSSFRHEGSYVSRGSLNKMTIAFVGIEDVNHPDSWSGIPFHIMKAMQRAGHDVKSISPLNRNFRYRFLLRKVFWHRQMQIDRHSSALKSYAKQIEDALAGDKPDLIFCTSSIPIAFLRSSVPIVYWTDAVFDGMVGYYDRFGSRDLKRARAQEESAMEGAALVVYSSDWAGETARLNYPAHAQKIVVVPFGANFLEDEPFRKRQLTSPLRLLFIGKDWERKGGPLALETTRRLHEQGTQVILDIVGCDPVEARRFPFTVVHGFLSRSDPAQVRQIRRLLDQAHFFFLPTRAETAGIVFCEASAFSLPILTTATGGVPTYVANGVSGITLPISADAERFAKEVRCLLSMPDRYSMLAQGAFSAYTSRLNWDTGLTTLLSRLNA